MSSPSRQPPRAGFTQVLKGDGYMVRDAPREVLPELETTTPSKTWRRYLRDRAMHGRKSVLVRNKRTIFLFLGLLR